jgi:ribonucleoside-diphosphate reductase alpha chain
MYNEEAIFNSKFFINNVNDEVKELVRKYGLRNSQLLTIPPTGTISTMLGISGGIEPIFNLSYFRKTESIHDEDVIYKVYTPVVEEYMKSKGLESEEDLPNIFVTAMTLKPQERIKMQQAWQKNIDASISSTINLPYEATVEDVYDIYMSAWKNDLKGITIYRDGCQRSGILTNEDTNKKKENEVEVDEIAMVMEVEEGMEKFVCTECGNEAIIPTGGCAICLQCGHSKCN